MPSAQAFPDEWEFCGSVGQQYKQMGNAASAGKTFIKMQNQLLNDDGCACFLVEAIAQLSQNIKWETTVDIKRREKRPKNAPLA